MERAGFVLPGGCNTCVGLDKARLPCRCGTLVRHTASIPAATPRERSESLLAVYHRCHVPIGAVLAAGRRKVTGAPEEFEAAWLEASHSSQLENVNTPEDWAAHVRR